MIVVGVPVAPSTSPEGGADSVVVEAVGVGLAVGVGFVDVELAADAVASAEPDGHTVTTRSVIGRA